MKNKKNIPQLLDLIEKRICYFSNQAQLDTLSDKEKDEMMSEMDIFCTFIIDKARLSLERAYELKKQKEVFGDNGCPMHKALMDRLEFGLRQVEELFIVGNHHEN